MLNLQLIDNLYAGLTRERQTELNSLLFKRSKQTVNYFHRQKDISLSKLEILADYFQMPLDYFRIGGMFKQNNVNGDGNQVGNLYVNSNLMIELEYQKREIASMQQVQTLLREKLDVQEEHKKTMEVLLSAKDEIIENLKKENARLLEGNTIVS